MGGRFFLLAQARALGRGGRQKICSAINQSEGYRADIRNGDLSATVPQLQQTVPLRKEAHGSSGSIDIGRFEAAVASRPGRTAAWPVPAGAERAAANPGRQA